MAEKIQKPRGTRDFYPEDMAWRRHLEARWRAVAVRNGFEEVDGPIYETLDLYKRKSGEGIVSELFSFRRTGGEVDYAVRAEFTPTLARMVAERANTMPKPVKWFAMPNLCRAEAPQRGRLREHWQWNVDVIGSDSPVADAEVIFTAVDLLREMGLTSQQVKVKVSHRDVVRRILLRMGVAEDKMIDAFTLLDRRDKITPDDFARQAAALGLDAATVERFNQVARTRLRSSDDWSRIVDDFGIPESDVTQLRLLHDQFHAFGIAEWCEYDLGIVRGLAYYTGTVFEIHETSGAERAIAGGGRYDNLIESFGGPATPAVGFGMGDVVLSLVLEDRGLKPTDVAPPADVFVLAATADAQPLVGPITAELRAAGLHTRFSYKTTTNVGKLLKDATNCRARFAVILDDKAASGTVGVKDLASGEQVEVARDALVEHLRDAI
ncbi:MAG: histidine--tRNA ligase [Phycisphaera sp.]|nr:histidine--tRNA ligase [Phycisphaera sp.]